MSRSVNRIILIGNVGREPELRETQTGAKVVNLSLATNHRFASNGEEERERTDWHRLTLWNRLAVFAQEYVKKGDRVFVEGRLGYDSYDRDGVTIPTAEITVREIVLLSPPREPVGESEASD
jgi:single-strand DNA-binding protein